MNQQDQIDIIKAHMAGRRVLVALSRVEAPSKESSPIVAWQELTRQECKFDFVHEQYKIEPRKLELFMSLPSGVFQALVRADVFTANPHVWVGNTPPRMLQPGHVIVKIHCTEPES